MSRELFLAFCEEWDTKGGSSYAARSSLIKTLNQPKFHPLAPAVKKNPDFDVISLSEMWPPQPGDKNKIAGVTPTKYFNCIVVLII